MDPREKPHILRVLTQVEEIIIARVDPILQVTHARGGQYKYSGHTISFPQDISTIVQRIPRHVEDIDFLIVRRHGVVSKCYVKISQVVAALLSKIQHDQYYRDVVIDYDLVNALHKRSTDVSSRLNFVYCDIEESEINETNYEDFHAKHFPSHASSFLACLPNERRQVEEIREFLDSVDPSHLQYIDWPTIGTSLVNEYNTEVLLDMAFPTLFPTGDADWLQPRICSVEFHEY